MDLSQQFRQLLHCPPWSGAGHVLPFPSVTVDVQGQLLPAAPLTLVADNLIIKFGGIMSGSIRARSRDSRVGSQCFVSGVCLHTSKIRARCHALWRSPESCQRKYFLFFMSTTIARTQRESPRASRRRAIAFLVVLNLYRPFIA